MVAIPAKVAFERLCSICSTAAMAKGMLFMASGSVHEMHHAHHEVHHDHDDGYHEDEDGHHDDHFDAQSYGKHGRGCSRMPITATMLVGSASIIVSSLEDLVEKVLPMLGKLL